MDIWCTIILTPPQEPGSFMFHGLSFFTPANLTASPKINWKDAIPKKYCYYRIHIKHIKLSKLFCFNSSLPSWKLTISPLQKRHAWRWVSFSLLVGYVIVPLEGNVLSLAIRAGGHRASNGTFGAFTTGRGSFRKESKVGYGTQYGFVGPSGDEFTYMIFVDFLMVFEGSGIFIYHTLILWGKLSKVGKIG